MLSELSTLGPLVLTSALMLGLVAGLVKGMTGFALPMILVSGLGSILSPELALAGLILPALISNLWQAFRQGGRAALASAKEHWRYMAMVLLFIAMSSQIVLSIPANLLFLILGLTITAFTSLQLAGWQPQIAPENKGRAELGVGTLAGVLGGLTGTWGPPTVLYLTALGTPKIEHVRAQGVIYASGAVVLTLAHLQSSVLSGAGLGLSVGLILPCLLGMGVGFAIQDRLDQQRFRMVVLVVLALAGLNLIRRGVFG
ncbi:sulfite exporter TauE/SafE family protein [Rhodobacteraceae bacterium]|nr:sulfite exporter TauE/SafE family protein [Paracoccaceae bacterium]